MHITVIIPAAGRSERFGTGDKLAQDLGGRPLLVRTVETFAKRDEVRQIIVAGPADDDDLASFRERYGPTLGFHGAVVVRGGRAARWETVQRAADTIDADATHVAVHDAARPGVDNALLDRVFQAADSLPCVVPGVPVTATVKRVSAAAREVRREDEAEAIADLLLGDETRPTIEAREVVETVDRTNLFEIQTPQVIAIDVFRRAYAQDDLGGATDDASLVERLGEPVSVVPGDIRNFKITTAADVALMRAILGLKAPAERPVHKRF